MADSSVELSCLYTDATGIFSGGIVFWWHRFSPPESVFYDFHTHLPLTGDPEVRSMVALDPKDRDRLSEAGYCCIGLHPWFLSADNWEETFVWVEKNAALPQVSAIGETGLDRLRGPALEIQRTVFERHVRVAEEMDKAVIVHCVRAFDALTGLRRSLRPRMPWIVHGFAKGPEIACVLVAAGCALSFGKALFSPDDRPIVRAFREIPDDRFLLETDGDPTVDIRAVYGRAAEIKGRPLEWVLEQVSRNTYEVLGGKMGR